MNTFNLYRFMKFFERLKPAAKKEEKADTIEESVVTAFKQKDTIEEAKSSVRLEHSEDLAEADHLEAESKLLWLKLKNGTMSPEESSAMYQTLDENTKKATRIRDEVTRREALAERKAA